ncbi:hypothetical protein Acsp02_51550 [Actinoplanes sp. NBRC 103695]|nr:hypothetical protein Acsp02_51550 [Actinoplanes sp. NBRC 103695]
MPGARPASAAVTARTMPATIASNTGASNPGVVRFHRVYSENPPGPECVCVAVRTTFWLLNPFTFARRARHPPLAEKCMKSFSER